MEPIGHFLKTVSGPFNPYIVWNMNPVKFPINSYEISFMTILLSYVIYTVVSLMTYKKPFNLDRLLHRGKYVVKSEREQRPVFNWKSQLLNTLIGITSEYTKWDKIIAWGIFFTNFVYQFGVAFVMVVIWNIFYPWNTNLWSHYFFYTSLIVPAVLGVLTTIWFLIGGCIDFKRLFVDLNKRINNPLDDGRVEGNVSLADEAYFSQQEQDQKDAKNPKN